MPSHFTIAGERFPLAERPVLLGGRRLRLATVPYSPRELDRIAALRGLKESAWPYWLEEWPATYALAEALEAEDLSARPPGAIDLGCGSGVLGAYLRARFGAEAFACDFNADACRLAALNADLNAPRRTDKGGARVFCADFRAFPSRARFGLTLAGEMLYDRANHGPILGFLARHLAPGGLALLADAGRSAAAGFAEKAVRMGFRAERRAHVVQAQLEPIGNTEGTSLGRDRNVDVYRLEKAG